MKRKAQWSAKRNEAQSAMKRKAQWSAKRNEAQIDSRKAPCASRKVQTKLRKSAKGAQERKRSAGAQKKRKSAKRSAGAQKERKSAKEAQERKRSARAQKKRKSANETRDRDHNSNLIKSIRETFLTYSVTHNTWDVQPNKMSSTYVETACEHTVHCVKQKSTTQSA
jgi:hypothetical protein